MQTSIVTQYTIAYSAYFRILYVQKYMLRMKS